MDERYNPKRQDRETAKRSPADLRRVLGRIYPKKEVDELMKRFGFETEQPEEVDFDYAAEDM